jgi:hypothetical protein
MHKYFLCYLFSLPQSFTAVLVLVMMLAMTITAFAEFKNCYLHPDNTGEVATSSLNAYQSHCSGYNSMDSTNNIYIRLQVNRGLGQEWERIWYDLLNPGEYQASPVASTRILLPFRTKICFYPSVGGVEGVGCCFDY